MAAVPDQMHYDVIMTALRHDQHVLTVKPLVLKYSQALEIEREAYRRGPGGRGRVPQALRRPQLPGAAEIPRGRSSASSGWAPPCLLEKWYYRHSNFQNWMTSENSDAFTYIGCHYVDLVHFITGLLPVAVSVYGIPDRFPNGKEGFLWTDARVIWNNGACLNVQNALGFPDQAPGTNTQGLTMYCKGDDDGALISHSDQYRGLKYSYISKSGDPGATVYAEPSTDYFQYLDLGGPGLIPVGYGYRSVEHIVGNCIRVENESAGEADALAARQRLLKELDAAGIMATPANSSYNELVLEAGRASIVNKGRLVEIQYGENARVTAS